MECSKPEFISEEEAVTVITWSHAVLVEWFISFPRHQFVTEPISWVLAINKTVAPTVIVKSARGKVREIVLIKADRAPSLCRSPESVHPLREEGGLGPTGGLGGGDHMVIIIPDLEPRPSPDVCCQRLPVTHDGVSFSVSGLRALCQSPPSAYCHISISTGPFL